MLFNFRLTPLENVPPWSRDGDQYLHWFGLTDGCYWLHTGDTELFRYREEVLEAYRYDNDSCKPYVDYPVVRLWEDLLEILPSALAPVPQTLASLLKAPNLSAWRTRVEHWMEAKENRLYEPAYEHATEWLRKRFLSSGHLVAGPKIWVWNDGTHIHIEWDNRERQIEGMPAWNACLDRRSWQLGAICGRILERS
jgi:hypothetical protein